MQITACGPNCQIRTAVHQAETGDGRWAISKKFGQDGDEQTESREKGTK